MGSKHIGLNHAVYEWFRAHPNEAMFSSAIASELGFKVDSVASTINRFVNTEGAHIKRVFRDGTLVRGMFIYSPSHNGDIVDNSPAERKPKAEFSDVPFPKQFNGRLEAPVKPTQDQFVLIPTPLPENKLNANGALYEYVGDTKAGTPMVRDESGKLYVLKEV